MLNLNAFATINQTNRNLITTTEQYIHIPTTTVIEVLNDHGWQVLSATQSNTRQPHRNGFQKHAVTLANPNYNYLFTEVGAPRMTLKHAHDGTSALNLMLSLWVKICSNGVHAYQGVNSARVLHRGFTTAKLETALSKFVLNLSDAATQVKEFRQIQLDPTEQLLLAQSAIELRYDPITDAFGEPMKPRNPDNMFYSDKLYPVTPQQMLIRRRGDDNVNNLWGAFNVIQENILERPQVKALSYNAKKNRFTARTIRPVNAIEANTKLNLGLWALAAKMAELKNGVAIQ